MIDNKPKKEAPEVRTYTDDMVRVIEDSGGTLVRKIIEEEQAHEVEKKNPARRHNRLYSLFGSVFLLLGVAVLFFLSISREMPLEPEPAVKQLFQQIIFTEASSLLEIGGFKKAEIVQALLDKKDQSQVREGEIEAIYFTEAGERMGLRHFIALAEANLPLDNIDFVDDNFLVGVFNNDQNKSLFFLIKARSFPDLFPGMRAWEKKMFSDLRGYFGFQGPEYDYLLSKSFEDVTVENKNARILSDAYGGPLLFYIFADNQSTVVTASMNAAREVIVRLRQGAVRK